MVSFIWVKLFHVQIAKCPRWQKSFLTNGKKEKGADTFLSNSLFSYISTLKVKIGMTNRATISTIMCNTTGWKKKTLFQGERI